MRHFVPLLTACAGTAAAIACLAQAPNTLASEPGTSISNASIQIAAVSKETDLTKTSGQKVICSRNRPLQSSDFGKLAANLPERLSLASNIVQLFCRDVRINTIVVRDYCAVIRS